MDDFFAAVGYGGVQLWKLLPRLKKEYNLLEKNENELTDLFKTNVSNNVTANKKFKNSNGVIVDDVNNCSVKFAKCCNPFPEDEIIGFITKGYGISVHKKDCVNIKNENLDRFVKVVWSDSIGTAFRTNIEVIANYTDEFLTNLTRKVSALNIHLISLNSKIIAGNRMSVLFSTDIKNQEHLRYVFENLSRINGVISIKRI